MCCNESVDKPKMQKEFDIKQRKGIKMKDTNESGRSMVEMLGVLAIIGVLSIGGIAGYTQAMRRYRANEILNAISMLAVTAKTRTSGEDVRYKDAYPGAPHITGLEEPGLGTPKTGPCFTTADFCAHTDVASGVVTVYVPMENEPDCKAVKSMIDGTDLMNSNTECGPDETTMVVTVS